MIGKLKEILAKYPKVVKMLGIFSLAITIIVATSFFFISYSLARHKRMVAQLRAQVIAQEAKMKVMASEQRLLKLDYQLRALKLEDEKHKAARKKLREEIDKESAKVANAKKRLEKDLQVLKGSKLKKLLKNSKQLLKEVL